MEKGVGISYLSIRYTEHPRILFFRSSFSRTPKQERGGEGVTSLPPPSPGSRGACNEEREIEKKAISKVGIKSHPRFEHCSRKERDRRIPEKRGLPLRARGVANAPALYGA
ncbi:hypothetical protein AVEN_268133-1 [Araneus ventricosus]|uniref:Uncharacterized protein n=1 Tax=Araneus ventricosus TaxID=182803 RepID=A0A4Y2K644_ARAVE|nr:hypothetical protein AVEN_268133-1 [Araneus ventricosus]